MLEPPLAFVRIDRMGWASRVLSSAVLVAGLTWLGACSPASGESNEPSSNGGAENIGEVGEAVTSCGATGGTGGIGGGTLCTSPGFGGGPAFTSVVCTGSCSVCNPLTGKCQPNPAACDSGDARDCSQCVGSGNTFNCVASQARCTGNCDECTHCGDAYLCSDNPAACTGNCNRCVGGGHNWSCQPNETLCPGSCSSCQGSGTNYSCAAQGCDPGDCISCGTNKIKVCTTACTWGGCVRGPCP